MATKTVVAIGNFDGVHCGHRALLVRRKKIAREKGLIPVVLTFEPHPRALFSPAEPLPRLTALRNKIALLFESGIEAVFVKRFDYDLAKIDGQTFIDAFIHGKIQASHIVVGDDFCFGSNRANDATVLKKIAATKQIGVDIVEKVLVNGERVSSTQIRDMLLSGNLKEATKLLGKPDCFTGKVVTGQQLGRKIGFPTLNIKVADNALPIKGVFAVELASQDRTYPAVANVGIRPTVEDNVHQLLIEVHVLAPFEERLTGKRVTVAFLEKIRDEKKFDTLEQLSEAIDADCQKAAIYFTSQDNQ